MVNVLFLRATEMQSLLIMIMKQRKFDDFFVVCVIQD